jgi:predicted ester cyclase
MTSNSFRNRELAKRYFDEVWNQQSTQAAEEIIHPETPTRFEGLKGPAGILKVVEKRREAFSNIHFEILRMVADESQVFIHFRFTGIHTGSFWGIEPTHKNVAFNAVMMFEVIDGKLYGVASVRDELTLLQQVGVIPLFENDGRQ